MIYCNIVHKVEREREREVGYHFFFFFFFYVILAASLLYWFNVQPMVTEKPITGDKSILNYLTHP